MASTNKTVAIVSGGMDSVTLAYWLRREQHRDIVVLSFDYGQRHRRELGFARLCADTLDAPHVVADLSAIRNLIASSALTNPDMQVPDGHYAEQTMRQTVVPNRNAVMLNVAASLAITSGADSIATGVHAGDHYIYPDCRPAFIDSLQTMLRIANEGFAADDFTVMAPFVQMTKADIATIGARLGVPWRETWSCYKGGEMHCGACGTCFERREAFAMAGLVDPTTYAATPHYDDPR